MYVGVEYESRFLLQNVTENLEYIIQDLELKLGKMGYTYLGEYLETDYYFLPKYSKKVLKYAIGTESLKGRVIYKERILILGNIVINLEISEEIIASKLVSVLEQFPHVKGNEFNFNRIGKLRQRRRKYIQQKNDEIERINCSVDIVNFKDSYNIFVEFETSVPSLEIVENLKKISVEFEMKTYFKRCVGGKKGMVLFENDE